MQTSIEDASHMNLNHQSQQTSPYTPEKDLFSLLQEVCECYSKENKYVADQEQNKCNNALYTAHHDSEAGFFAQSYGYRGAADIPLSSIASGEDGENEMVRDSARQLQKNLPPSHLMHRAASANDCQTTNLRDSHLYRAVSSSPSRMGLNTYYTYRSLPDLSFLKERRKSVHSGHDEREDDDPQSPVSSLFDPVKIPIILSPIMDVEQPHSHSCSPCRSQSCSPTRRQTMSCCGCPCSNRSQSSPSKIAGNFTKKSKSFSTVGSPCREHHSHSSPVHSTQLHHPDPQCTDHNIQPMRKRTTSCQETFSRVKNGDHYIEKPRSISYNRDLKINSQGGASARPMVVEKQMPHKVAAPQAVPKMRSVSHSPICSRLQRAPGATKSASTGKLGTAEVCDGRKSSQSCVVKTGRDATVDENVHYTCPRSGGNQLKRKNEGGEGFVGCERNVSGGSDGFSPSDGTAGVTAVGSGYGSASSGAGSGNNISVKSSSSTTSSSSSSSKKATSGQYVVSCFSSSSVSSTRSEQKSSTSTVDSKCQEVDQKNGGLSETKIGSGKIAPGSSAKLQRQSSVDSDCGSVSSAGSRRYLKVLSPENSKLKAPAKKGKIPIPVGKTSNLPVSSAPQQPGSGKQQELKLNSKLPTLSRSKDVSPCERKPNKALGKVMSRNALDTGCLEKRDSEFCEIYNGMPVEGEIFECEIADVCEHDVTGCSAADSCDCAEYSECDDLIPSCSGCGCVDQEEAELQAIIGGDSTFCCHCSEREEHSHVCGQGENVDLEIDALIDGRGCAALSEDLERILFQPPHLESSLEREKLKAELSSQKGYPSNEEENSGNNCEKSKDDIHVFEIEISNPPDVIGELRMYRSFTDMKTSASGNALLAKKGLDPQRRGESDKCAGDKPSVKPAETSPASQRVIKRVVNEAYPAASRHQAGRSDQKQGNRVQQQIHPKRRWSTGSSLSTLHFDALYSLEEESGHSSSISPNSSYDDFTPQNSSSFCRDVWHAPWDHHSKFILQFI